MYENENDLFIKLQKLSIDHADKIDVYIDEDGEVEFEIELDFFLKNLKKILGI
jgi:hypothetical protein